MGDGRVQAACRGPGRRGRGRPSRGGRSGGTAWRRPIDLQRRFRVASPELGARAIRSPSTKEQIDMSLFQRAHDILAAKANKALDAAEKPDEMLDLSYEQMLDQLTKVRQALVTVAASRKQIELQGQQLQHSVDHLQDQAKTALSLGKEDLAREALSRKATAQAQI